MKTLLVKSAYYIAEEGGSGAPEYPKLPCQLFAAAAYLKKQGLNIEVIDSFNDKLIDYNKYDNIVVWIPAIEKFYQGMNYILKAKAAGKITIAVLNDPFEGVEREVMQKYSEIDYMIRLYEREIILGVLLKTLEAGNNLPEDKRGILFRENGDIIDGGFYPCIKTLDHLTSYAAILESIDLKKYPEAQIETSRGCPYKCTFCSYNSTKLRNRKVDDIISELNVLQKYYKHVWFHSFNMLLDKKFMKDLCNALIENDLKIKWSTDCRMDIADDAKTLELYQKAGCVCLNFGLESVDGFIRNEHIKKRITDIQLNNAIKTCLKVKIRPSINLMVGVPWDSKETMEKTEKFIKNTPYVDNIQMFRPQRGTPLYSTCKELGLIKKDFSIFDYNVSRKFPMIDTLYLSKKDIYKYWKYFSFLAIMKHTENRIKEIGIKGILQQLRKKKIKLYYFRLLYNILLNKLKRIFL